MQNSEASKMIFLTGLSGSGKSTVGRELARLMGREFSDTDESIVEKEALTIRELFDSCGECRFREIESEVIQDSIENAMRDNTSGSVIALGGGSLLARDNVEIIKNAGTLVYLDTTCEVAAERLRRKRDRPLTLDEAGQPLPLSMLSGRLEKLLQARLAGYGEASYTVMTTSRSVSLVCQDILDYLAERI